MTPSDAVAAPADPAATRRTGVAAQVAFVLRSTQQRPQSEAEVRAKLRARAVDDDDADQVLARAKELGAVDDDAFARAWVADRGQARGYGGARLRQELRRRLVPEALIAGALAVLDQRDDEAVATALAKERYARLPARLEPAAVARRLAAALVRRGYPPGLAQRVAITVSGLDRRWD